MTRPPTDAVKVSTDEQSIVNTDRKENVRSDKGGTKDARKRTISVQTGMTRMKTLTRAPWLDKRVPLKIVRKEFIIVRCVPSLEN